MYVHVTVWFYKTDPGQHEMPVQRWLNLDAALLLAITAPTPGQRLSIDSPLVHLVDASLLKWMEIKLEGSSFFVNKKLEVSPFQQQKNKGW